MTVPDPDALVAAAHHYARRGWRVLPLHIATETGGCSCGRPTCSSIGKHPVQNAWQDTPPMSGADVQATFEDGMRNIGIATGDPSGFWVLDVDLDKPGTLERVKELQAGRTLGETHIVKTGGGGYQFYFKMPDFQVTNSARRLPDGIDVRGTGGQVVAPPSVSGKGVYTTINDADPIDAPDWLLELVRPLPAAAPVDQETLPKLTDLSDAERARLEKYTNRIIEAELDRLRECKAKGWGGPGWNDTTYQVACTLIELANSPWCFLSLVGAHGFVAEFAPRDAGFNDAAVESCFASALKTVGQKARALPEDRSLAGPVYPGDPLSDPAARAVPTPDGGEDAPAPSVHPRVWSDLGNARRMVDLYGHRLRWVRESEDWAVYDRGVWSLAGASAGRALAQEMVEGLIDRELELYDPTPGGEDGDQPSEQDRFKKWAIAQQMSSKIGAALKECTGRPELQAQITDFDTEPMLLNVANGIVDLRTGELADHDPAKMMMLQSPVRYDPNAEHPLWDAFLERCLPDPEVRLYLQKTFGYSLTGSMAEQALFIHHGSGANGKSVFLVVASHLAGMYGQVVPRETLLAKGNSSTEHPTSTARMRGKRFLQASETAAGRRLDEETVKGLTGGEDQTARFMGADFFDFTPTGKIHFVTNHLPRLTDAESIWRRLHLIAWSQTIPIEERDPRLAEKIIAQEAEGVLAWAVRGAVMWKPGDLLQEPASMRSDLRAYREDQDVLGEFLGARVELDKVSFTSTDDLYGAYSAWCFNSGIRSPMTKQDLARALRERKMVDKRTGKARGFLCKLVPLVSYVGDPLTSA